MQLRDPVRAVHLVDRRQPLGHACRGFGKQPQGLCTESLASGIDETVPGADLIGLPGRRCGFRIVSGGGVSSVCITVAGVVVCAYILWHRDRKCGQLAANRMHGLGQ